MNIVNKVGTKDAVNAVNAVAASASIAGKVRAYAEGMSASAGNTGYLCFYRSKVRGDASSKRPSRYVELPAITEQELQAAWSELLPMIHNAVDAKRLEMVREVVDALTPATDLDAFLAPSEYTLAKVIEFAAASARAESARFSKKLVGEWCGEVLEAVLVEAILARNPATPSDKVEQTVRNTTELLVALAGDTTKLQWAAATVAHVQKVLALPALVGDEMAQKLAVRAAEVRAFVPEDVF